jgi:hypothetical protein
MDYALCDQTVTVYRKNAETVCRQVIENAFFALEEGRTGENAPVRNFLLIVPGPEVKLFPGDRVLEGIGPVEVDWEAFLPIHIPGLVEVGRTRHYRLGGEICHVEAEHRWN